VAVVYLICYLLARVRNMTRHFSTIRLFSLVPALGGMLLGGELLAASLTGYTTRSVDVLTPDVSVMVSGREVNGLELAEAYRPIIRINPAYVPPFAKVLWYEVVDQEDSVTLVYYLDWENEIYPQPLLHFLYEIYRRAVYGSVHDIEYIEITVGKLDGVVTRIRFETTYNGNAANHNFPEHLRVFGELNNTRTGYQITVVDQSGNIARTDTVSGIWGSDNRPVLGVMTWNHLYTLLDDSYNVYSQIIDVPLQYLTDDVYRAYKFARRSHGDIATMENETPRNILRILFWGSSILIGYYCWIRRIG